MGGYNLMFGLPLTRDSLSAARAEVQYSTWVDSHGVTRKRMTAAVRLTDMDGLRGRSSPFRFSLTLSFPDRDEVLVAVIMGFQWR